MPGMIWPWNINNGKNLTFNFNLLITSEISLTNEDHFTKPRRKKLAGDGTHRPCLWPLNSYQCGRLEKFAKDETKTYTGVLLEVEVSWDQVMFRPRPTT